MPLRAADAHYRAQQRLQASALAAALREWASMGEDLDTSWARVGPRMAMLVSAAQVGAARDGIAYVGAALAEQRIAAAPEFTSEARAFGGLAYSIDGLTAGHLEPMLYGSVVRARAADTDTLPQRLAAGRSFLVTVVPSQVADAARMAVGSQIFARPEIGWVRMVNPPCCKRCAVLAGAHFKHNAGFPRHPRCDCRHVPTSAASADDVGYTIGSDDVKDLTVAQRRAIDDGADMNQVINSERGRMGDYTTEGTTRGGWASYVQRELARQRGEAARETAVNVGSRGYVKDYVVRRTGPRPTPEAIYKYATSREDAIRLLAANGYIVGDLTTVAALAR